MKGGETCLEKLSPFNSVMPRLTGDLIPVCQSLQWEISDCQGHGNLPDTCPPGLGADATQINTGNKGQVFPREGIPPVEELTCRGGGEILHCLESFSPDGLSLEKQHSGSAQGMT